MSLFNDHSPPSTDGPPASIEGCDSFLAAIARLTVSSEPATVLSSLAALCVPAFCDECIVGIDQEGQPIQWIRYPETGPAPGAPTHQDARQKVSAYVQIVAEDGVAPRCGGIVTYGWHRNTPSAADRVFARLLTDRAAAIVAEQRRIAAAELAAAAIDNLKAGLVSNRRVGLAIGILMATHKVTETDAFDLLRLASQREHRKVREIADEVVLTGEIQQSPAPRRPRTGRCTQGAGY